MSWILTRSGKHFDFVNPLSRAISIVDIAHGLSNECRYAGQVSGFYSVAQHSVLASYVVPPEHQMEALLHDAAEAYCKDIPRPLKALLRDYRDVERRVDLAIRLRFNLPTECSDAVKRADLVMLATERRDLMPPDDASPWAILDGIAPLPERIEPWLPEKALKHFWHRFADLALARNGFHADLMA